MGDDLEIYFQEHEVLNFSKKYYSKSENIITINPTSKCSKNQEWSIDKWVSLIREFPMYKFIQIGLPNEEYVDGAYDLRGKLSLREACIAVKNSFLYIGVDSFFGHVSSAMDVNSIILFGDSSPNIYSHDNSFSIYKNLECSPCYELLNGRICPYRRICPYNKKCMNSIQVSDVVKVIKTKLN